VKKSRRQLDLFVAEAPAGPLDGLAVRLPDRCRCGRHVAQIARGVGPHLAALECVHCRMFRGWLPREAHRFLTELVNKFGRPIEPIAIRRRGQ
jgi:hypothetical protein